MTRHAIAFAFLVSSASAAMAHGGHMGELAGHAHWIGAAAVVGAAVLAALVAKAKKRDDEAVDAETEHEAEEEAEGSTA